MLHLLLLACAPVATMAPPDPFADPGRHTLGGSLSGGFSTPGPRPDFSPQLWFVGHPNERLELGASGFVGSAGLDWPREVLRGGAGGYLRFYAMHRERAALGFHLETTGGSFGLGAPLFVSVSPIWSVYTVPSLGVDLGATAGSDHPFHLDCGFYLRGPVGVGYTRDTLRIGLEVDAYWSPLINAPGRTVCGLDTWADTPEFTLQGGVTASWTLPVREG